jgi:uncharacterized protein YigA (DUF484 family)
MGSVIQFEEHAVASLRQRLGAAESANEDLVAFARGHAGAVASLHQAVLAAIAADGLDALLGVVAGEWPQLLAIDEVALALVVGARGFRISRSGTEPLDAAMIGAALDPAEAVRLQSVGRGHPLFGAAASAIRSQALIRIDAEPPHAHGLLLLGQHEAELIDTQHGAHLLRFLGQSLGAIIRRWTLNPTD